MRIAVLSGKGGTGKTTVAASLARVLPGSQYADCDVEEPNGHIFLKPQDCQSVPVEVAVPEVAEDLCTGCGACARICQFNAIAVVKDKVLVFAQLCHHCGACRLVCPTGAISEIDRRIGTVDVTPDRSFIQGRLEIGEPSGVPVVKAVQSFLDPERTAILDCPPGAGCSVVEALSGCDFALLVAEPTPFGLHDLKMAVKLTALLKVPAGVVINKADGDLSELTSFCQQAHLPILLQIPFCRTLASDYALGYLPVDQSAGWRTKFTELAKSFLGMKEEQDK